MAQYREALTRLRSAASPERAATLTWFFKTGKGQYGEGDRFLGLTLPELRAIARDFRELDLDDVERLLESEWHEARALALVVMNHQYRRGDAATQKRIYDLYMRRTDRINNWDLVDISAPHIVGRHLLTRSRAPLKRLAKSKDLWERRIAIVATQELIRQGQFADTLAIALQLLDDEHDLIHKATGWMLREVGKRNERALLLFLDRHAAHMPRTALRYSLERLPTAKRERYMRAGRAKR